MDKKLNIIEIVLSVIMLICTIKLYTINFMAMCVFINGCLLAGLIFNVIDTIIKTINER